MVDQTFKKRGAAIQESSITLAGLPPIELKRKCPCLTVTSGRGILLNYGSLAVALSTAVSTEALFGSAIQLATLILMASSTFLADE
jgi:hypothetical protein